MYYINISKVLDNYLSRCKCTGGDSNEGIGLAGGGATVFSLKFLFIFIFYFILFIFYFFVAVDGTVIIHFCFFLVLLSVTENFYNI